MALLRFCIRGLCWATALFAGQRRYHMGVKTAILFFLLCLPAVADLAAGQQALTNGDYATALKEFLPLAKQGNVVAQFNLGGMYAEGQGVVQDYAEAVRWYRKAADQGYAAAQSSLGRMYVAGRGVAQDYAEAVRWYRKAADQGDAFAQSSRQDSPFPYVAVIYFQQSIQGRVTASDANQQPWAVAAE